MTEYEAIREKAAQQKRDIERALTRFTAKTGKTHSLFKDDNSMFPCEYKKCILFINTNKNSLIKCKKKLFISDRMHTSIS